MNTESILAYLKKLEKTQGIRILHAFKDNTISYPYVTFYYLRPMQDYLSVFQRDDTLQINEHGTFFEGVDLKEYLRRLMEEEPFAEVRRKESYLETAHWKTIQKLHQDMKENAMDYLECKKVWNSLFYDLVTGTITYTIVDEDCRLTDNVYEKIPEAEITIEDQYGQTLYVFAYEAENYSEYGVMDISWLENDFMQPGLCKEEHILESYDSMEDGLQSPYAKLYIELKEMLKNTLEYSDDGFYGMDYMMNASMEEE